jgi:hypothetical protein
MEIALTIRQMPINFVAQTFVCVTACHYPRTLIGDPNEQVTDIFVSHTLRRDINYHANFQR